MVVSSFGKWVMKSGAWLFVWNPVGWESNRAVSIVHCIVHEESLDLARPESKKRTRSSIKPAPFSPLRDSFVKKVVLFLAYSIAISHRDGISIWLRLLTAPALI